MTLTYAKVLLYICRNTIMKTHAIFIIRNQFDCLSYLENRNKSYEIIKRYTNAIIKYKNYV